MPSGVLGNAGPFFAAARRFPYFAHIGYMKVDEVAKGLEAGEGPACRRQPLIDPGLRLAGLSVRRQSVWLAQRSFRLIWTRVRHRKAAW